MAKVVKQGKPWSKVLKCLGNVTGAPSCGAKILLNQLDIWPLFDEFRQSNAGRFMCPECGEESEYDINSIIPQGTKPTPEEIQKIKNEWKEKIRNWKNSKE